MPNPHYLQVIDTPAAYDARLRSMFHRTAKEPASGRTVYGGRGQLHDVMLGSAPFVITLLVMIALLVLIPDIALVLPEVLAR
jgi:hypothetical protein